MFNTLIFLAFLCREQPPPRGCVLKQQEKGEKGEVRMQPPPRGCVLKRQDPQVTQFLQGQAAASARLCVET